MKPESGVVPGSLPERMVVAVALMAGTAATTAYRNPSSRRFFLTTILIAVLDLVFFALNGTRL